MSKSSDEIGRHLTDATGTWRHSTQQAPGSPPSLDPLTPTALAPAPVGTAQRVFGVRQTGGQLAMSVEPGVLCKFFGVTDPR
jgi:hypothetical protein